MDVVKFARKSVPCKSCGAVIVAAGNASRMGGIDKIMADLGGEPVIVRTVRAFQEAAVIRGIVVVTREDLIRPVSDLCRNMDKVIAVVAGGKTRQESVMLGLNVLAGEYDLAAIADGARPFVSEALIDRTVRAAHSYGAAVPALGVKDTVKVEKGGFIAATPERKTLKAAQTPQVFDFDLLRGALAKAEKEGAEITDDASAVERLGFPVKLVEGDERNIKITTPFDLRVGKMLLEEMK